MSGDKPIRLYGASFALILAFVDCALWSNVNIGATRGYDERAIAMIPHDPSSSRSERGGKSADHLRVRIHKELDRIKMKGIMSSEEDQKTLVGLVKASFPSATITNWVKLREAATHRDVKIGGLSFALKLLGYVETGKALVDDNGVAMEGSASTAVILSEVKKTLADDRPTGVPIRGVRIAPPMRSWTASIRKEGTLTISGVVPDEGEAGHSAAAVGCSMRAHAVPASMRASRIGG